MKLRINDYTDSEFLHYYDLLMEFRRKHPTPEGHKRSPFMTKFCKRRGITAKKLQWLAYRFFYKEQYRPLEHKADIETVKMFHESGLSKKEFCKQYNVSINILVGADMHLRYKARLEKLLKNRPAAISKTNALEPLPEFPIIQDTVPPIVQPKPVKERNTVYLQSGGITVNIDHTVGRAKLIKILEFLEVL